MPCCSHCQGAEKIFDAGTARGDLEDYRKHGPSKQTRLLLDTIRQIGAEGLALLDIGGGVGAIQHELFKSGARSAVHVDASTAYLGASQEEAARLGHRERVTYLHGNFVDLAPQVEPADVVTLDRVICCYPDMPSLVSLSAARATKLYGLVYPRDAWWMRLGMSLMNAGLWLQRNPFRIFVHPSDEVERIIQSQGLKPHFQRNSGLWRVVVYART